MSHFKSTYHFKVATRMSESTDPSAAELKNVSWLFATRVNLLSQDLEFAREIDIFNDPFARDVAREKQKQGD